MSNAIMVKLAVRRSKIAWVNGLDEELWNRLCEDLDRLG
jgi:hypothetical protein